MSLSTKHILGLKDLSKEDISLILDTAESLKEILNRKIKKVPTLRGKTIVTLFFEPSTRTRTSFELAGKWLSADTINISASTSSVAKGETLFDTAQTLEAMKPDIIVMRHSASGSPHMLSQLVKPSIINAGDGAHEHPTQALLDMMTIKENRGTFEGLKVAIIGDISHSRVVRSNIYGLTKMGVEVAVCGPAMMMPKGIEKMGVSVYCEMKETIKDADIIMMLRVQLERQNKNLFPSFREYAKFFCLKPEHLKLAKEDVLIMHPGPINRGIEISPEVADGPYSVILQQVTNGVAVRMALFYLLAGGDDEITS